MLINNQYQNTFSSVSAQKAAELLKKIQEHTTIAIGIGKMGRDACAAMQRGGLYSMVMQDIAKHPIEEAIDEIGVLHDKALSARALSGLQRANLNLNNDLVPVVFPNGNRIPTLQGTLAEQRLQAQEFLDKFLEPDTRKKYGEAMFVFEAGPESVPFKTNLVKFVSGAANEDALIGSNTSSLSIDEMAKASANPERVFGWHFFVPADRNQLLEIIKGEKTSNETMVAAHNLAISMGYKPIMVWKDSPCATANRILVGVLMEAARIYEDGIAPIEVVDKVFLETFYPEQIGVQTTKGRNKFKEAPKLSFFKDETSIYNEIKNCDTDIQKSLKKLQGKEKIDTIVSLVTKKAELLDKVKGNLNQKIVYAGIVKNVSSLGSFYKPVVILDELQQKAKIQFKAVSDYQTQITKLDDYLKPFNITPYEFPKALKTTSLQPYEAKQLVADRLKGAYIAIGQQVYLEGLSSPQDIEMACEEGFKYNYGPLKMAKNLGKEEVERLTTLVNQGLNGQTGICPPGVFVELNDHDLSGVQTYIQDNVAHILMGSSHVQNLLQTDNSLSPEMIKGISAAIAKFESDENVKTIMLRSQGGKDFCQGADLDYVKNKIGFDLGKAMEYIKLGKDLMNQIAACKKPTVAVVSGKALGGGVELASACDYRIVTANAAFAMPENALGLDPEWGGTERVPALIGKLLAVPFICNSRGIKWSWLNADEACRVGLGDNKKPILQSQLPIYLADLSAGKIEGINISEKPNRKPAFDKSVAEYPTDVVLKFKLNKPYEHKRRFLTRRIARETEKLIQNSHDPAYREASLVTTNPKKLIGKAKWVNRLYIAPIINGVQSKIFAPLLEKLGLG